MDPQVRTPDGRPPTCRREAVYLPEEDVLLTAGYPAGDEDGAGLYVYDVAENTWHRTDIPAPEGREMADVAGQNRSMTYDPKRDLVLMILGEGRGNQGPAMVYGLRYSEGAGNGQ